MRTSTKAAILTAGLVWIGVSGAADAIAEFDAQVEAATAGEVEKTRLSEERAKQIEQENEKLRQELEKLNGGSEAPATPDGEAPSDSRTIEGEAPESPAAPKAEAKPAETDMTASSPTPAPAPAPNP